MKPFDLQVALSGKPVQTRDGRKVIEIKLMEKARANTMSVVVVYEGGEVQRYNPDGNWLKGGVMPHPSDLVMAPNVAYTLLWQRKDSTIYLGSSWDTLEKAEQAVANALAGNSTSKRLLSIIEVAAWE